jgi:biotin carboxylase
MSGGIVNNAGSAAVAAVVDGYSVGCYLPAAFAKLGVDVVHVQSTAELNPKLQAPDLTAYRANLVCADGEAREGMEGMAGIDETAAALAAYPLVAVLPGAEPGVQLADALSERMGLATNGTAMSAARRDKFLMIEALRAAGIRCARQFSSSSPEELAAWAEREGSYPVVVKPQRSAGSDSVSICHDADEVARSARTILDVDDLFCEANTTVLVQSYLDGPEFVIDTVSADGDRYVCGAWQYLKTVDAGRPLYERDIVLDPADAPVPDLIAYVDTVLDALAIRHGPTHAEVIMTADGPALVELGARLNGALHPDYQDRCFGTNQADATALAYARPDEFRRRLGGRVYEKRAAGMVYNSRTRRDGVVRAIDQAVVDEIEALPSVYRVVLRLRPGDRIRPTRELRTSPLRVDLMADDEAQITVDQKTIAELADLVYLDEPR